MQSGSGDSRLSCDGVVLSLNKLGVKGWLCFESAGPDNPALFRHDEAVNLDPTSQLALATDD